MGPFQFRPMPHALCLLLGPSSLVRFVSVCVLLTDRPGLRHCFWFRMICCNDIHLLLSFSLSGQTCDALVSARRPDFFLSVSLSTRTSAPCSTTVVVQYEINVWDSGALIRRFADTSHSGHRLSMNRKTRNGTPAQSCSLNS